MIDGKRVLALIPARSGSKGLPGKNIRPLGGKPLLAWPIEAARASRLVDDVVISTDSAEFAEIAERHGARAPFLRPAELAADTAPSIGFILHAIDTLEAAGERFDYLIVLEPTSPLTEGTDIDAAIERLDAAGGEADALVGVTPMVTQHPAFFVRIGEDGRISPYGAADFANLPRRQDIDPVFCLDGSLYLSTVEAIRRERSFCHTRTIAFETERHKAFEVDDLVDFLCIEAISQNLDVIRAASDKA
jgi:N-acylneuraminate cytidylyltransferase/CMP-N,N'-diacetyllegionaminic acid synthase